MRCWLRGAHLLTLPITPTSAHHLHPICLSALLIPQPRNQTLSPAIQRLHWDKQLWYASKEKKKIHSEMIIHEVFVNALEFSLEAKGRLLERTSPQLGLSFPVFLSLSLFSLPAL